MALILNFFLVFSFLNAHAQIKKFPPAIIPKVIYGIDNRMDVYQSSDSLMNSLARSTAAQILNDNFILKDDVYSLVSKTLAEEGICKSERFSNQIVPANCTGFLVAPDILVTAGHCVNSDSDCGNHSWFFDFSNDSSLKSTFTFKKDQVFHCTRIIAREKDEEIMSDYAVLKLDRPVLGRAPLKFRSRGKVADDAVLTVIGHPSGLPLKITPAADMRDNSNPIYFVTNSDTYSGNSGSPVIDSRTGVVEGILVRGDTDYTQKDNEECSVSVHHDLDLGRGEEVTRITIIDVLQK